MIVTQGVYKSSLRRANRSIKRQCIRFCFFAFKALYKAVAFVFRPRFPVEFINPIVYDSVFGFAGKGQTFYAAMLMSTVRDMKCKIKGNNRMSLDKWAHRNETDLRQAFGKCYTKNMYKIVKQCMPSSGISSNIRLRALDGSGKIAASFVESRKIARSYFCELFAGSCQPLSSLLDKDRALKIYDIKNGVSLPLLDQNIFPTFGKLGVKFSHRRPLLGVGEDVIGSEVVARFPHLFASLYHPLAVKSVGLLEAPIQFKGGMIMELFKDKGPPDDIDNYRDIMLASEVGKCVVSTVRPALNDMASKYVSETQYGSGLN